MTIDHIAIWTTQPEQLKDYYVKYFNGSANEKYFNKDTLFESYFITFDAGSRLEIMKKPGIMEMVTGKSKELSEAGYRILRGPRKTGDGYFEFETLDPDNNRIEVAARFVE
jgi:lactoylglutathione lyase